MFEVLAECPGLLHNSLNAATKGPAAGRCICPKALELKESDQRRRTEEKRLERTERAEEQRGNTSFKDPAHEKNYRQGVTAPYLPGRKCDTPQGRKITDTYNGPASTRPAGILAAHREMCFACPERAGCLAWAMKAELPAGSWGGMYGGYTAAERKAIKKGTKRAA